MDALTARSIGTFCWIRRFEGHARDVLSDRLLSFPTNRNGSHWQSFPALWQTWRMSHRLVKKHQRPQRLSVAAPGSPVSKLRENQLIAR